MKIFLTGASGRIGTRVTRSLVAREHSVVALIRSEASEAAFRKQFADEFARSPSPISIVRGTLHDDDILSENAKASDGVIHCGLDHSNLATALVRERQVLEIFAKALEGTGKPLLVSSGAATLLSAHDDETSTRYAQGGPRGEIEGVVIGYKDRGVRSVPVRLAMNVHSAEQIHMFEQLLIGAEKTLGYIPYTHAKWSAAHADDAGLLYVLAMEKAEPGEAVHAVDELIPTQAIAELLARRTGKVAKPLEQDRAGELGWLGQLLYIDQNISWTKTKEKFGWDAKGQKLLDEMEQADDAYFGL